ncbi:MAG: hypothetical protein K8R16_05280 [Anaerolineales bacterium]|nr:hypothetical protein [Anaerolineales bacterium]
MNKITNKTLLVIMALEGLMLGIFVGLEKGFSFEPQSTLNALATLGGNRHLVAIIAPLIFIPLLAKQVKGGFLALMIVVSITGILTIITIVDLSFVNPGSEITGLFISLVMLVVQVLVLISSYRARKEMIESNVHG